MLATLKRNQPAIVAALVGAVLAWMFRNRLNNVRVIRSLPNL